jgi:hypothetical protein
MKKTVCEFFRRGLTAAGLGPLVLAIIYLILEHNGTLVTLSVNSVCKGIFSLLGLAFIAGGINVIYQIEKLPLMLAILIHGCVLYLTYLVIYLINDWLAFGVISVLVFTGIFIVGFVLIWVFIYFFTKRSIKVVNEELSKRRK